MESKRFNWISSRISNCELRASSPHDRHVKSRKMRSRNRAFGPANEEEERKNRSKNHFYRRMMLMRFHFAKKTENTQKIAEIASPCSKPTWKPSDVKISPFVGNLCEKSSGQGDVRREMKVRGKFARYRVSLRLLGSRGCLCLEVSFRESLKINCRVLFVHPV